MYNGKKVAVVMPAYNAAKTLLKTYREAVAQPFVDRVIVVDDASGDETYEIARKLDKVLAYRKETNTGYGGNQKQCYRLALEDGADIVIMVHPDYQYTPLLIPAMAAMIGNGLYHCVLGSRILGGCALRGGMPFYKYLLHVIVGDNRYLASRERQDDGLADQVRISLVLGVYRNGRIAGERLRTRRRHHHVIAVRLTLHTQRAPDNRIAHVPKVTVVRLVFDLVVRKRRSAPRTPVHDVVALVD